MKIVAKQIDMIASFTKEGVPTPIRFKYYNEGEDSNIIKIDRVIFRETEKLAGNNMIVFRCQSLINNIERMYEIKYELATCKWILFKI